MNLFEEFNNIVDQEFIDKIKPNLDDNLGNLREAIEGIYYTLVAGLIRRTNSDMSSGMLYNQIKEKFEKSASTSNLRGTLFKNANFNKISEDGSKIISQIFPAYKSPLISMISTYAGTSKNNTVKFTGITASILVYILGNKIKSENLSKEDLVDFIKQHHESLFNVAPESLMEKMIPALGLQELNQMRYTPPQPNKKAEIKSLTNIDDDQPGLSNNYTAPSSDFKMNDISRDPDAPLVSKNMLIGLVGAAIVACLAYYLYANRENISFLNGKKEAQEVVVDETLLNPNADSLAKAKLDSVKIAADTNSTIVSPKVELQGVTSYLEDKTELSGRDFDISGMKFVPNSFELQPVSLPVVDEFAKIMTRNPVMQIKITAFSEKGDAKLANKRAFTIKRILQEKGIADIRIDAGPGGKGGDSPKIKIVEK